MQFPLILYMSPPGPKWQPKFSAHPRRPAPRPIITPVIRNLEVSNSLPRGLVINEPNFSSTRIHEEIHMYTKRAVMSAWPVLGAAVVACTLFAGSVAAKDQEFTVAIQVSTQGLDLKQPAGAQEFMRALACCGGGLHAWQPGRPGALPGSSRLL